MKNYIMIIVYAPTVAVNGVEAKLEKLKQLMESFGLRVKSAEFLLTRKLAYAIKNNTNAHYCEIVFSLNDISDSVNDNEMVSSLQTQEIFQEILRKNQLDTVVIRQMILEENKATFIRETIKTFTISQ